MKLITLIYNFIYFFAIIGQVQSDFTLLTFGDPGQIDQFYKNKKIETPDNPTETLTFSNFENVLNNDLSGKKYVCRANNIVILGDMMYTEGGKMDLKSGAKDASKLGDYKKRLSRGWEAFKKLIQKFTNNCNDPNDLNPLSKNTNGKNENLKLIAGNHMYDVDFKAEAKEMEKKEKLKHQLFIGKVTDIIGFDKTLELLRECNNTIKC